MTNTRETGAEVQARWEAEKAQWQRDEREHRLQSYSITVSLRDLVYGAMDDWMPDGREVVDLDDTVTLRVNTPRNVPAPHTNHLPVTKCDRCSSTVEVLHGAHNNICRRCADLLVERWLNNGYDED